MTIIASPNCTRVGIYARVSIPDKVPDANTTKLTDRLPRQNPEVQLTPLREYCQRQGWTIKEYVDRASSVKMNKREQFTRLLEDCRLKHIDTIVIWKLDRIARSMRDYLNIISLCERNHTTLIIHTTPMLSFYPGQNDAIANLTRGILMQVAEFERELTIERVRAGIEEYKRKHGGQWVNSIRNAPSKKVDRGKVEEMIKEGMSIRAIAKVIGVSRATVGKRVKDWAKDETVWLLG